MVRALLRSFKPFFAAIWILAFLFCAAEVGLRLYEARNGPPAIAHVGASRGMSAQTVAEQGPQGALHRRSWFTHHGFQPSQAAIVKNVDTGEPVELRTNGFGLRGGPVIVPKPPGVYRILCLGDERVLGADVAGGETWAARLEGYLRSRAPMRIEVVNAGIPGYCPLLCFLQYRHELSSLQPDLTLLDIEMGDIADDHSVRRHALMNGGTVPAACPHPELLASEGVGIGGIKEPLLLAQRARQWYTASRQDVANASDADDIDLPRGRYAWIKPDGPDWSLHIEQALAPVVELDRLTDGQFSRLVVVLSPAPWQVSPTACDAATRSAAGIPEGAHYADSRPFDLLGAFLTSQKIPYCDVSPAFRAAHDRDRLFLSRAPRYSAAGHDLHARMLAAWVLRNVPAAWNQEEIGIRQ
ncbi:MAG: hypothetical protein WD066_10640 [Planctomycetaceae bacterium]